MVHKVTFQLLVSLPLLAIPQCAMLLPLVPPPTLFLYYIISHHCLPTVCLVPNFHVARTLPIGPLTVLSLMSTKLPPFLHPMHCRSLYSCARYGDQQPCP